ncbi:MAG: AI-2E family transporter [Bacteroidetes bacterium GWE2_39_28]|nr:MAG: AI-2E family transporter [Bacteroidetes bacterium GWE2_39_28]OFY14877.1 MAG: AI-2E family transporter [Bacteroidetes bacterium GWF2_39_10]OFZ07794.1 MAG: AI-2E family transporter [Bacteroidetes bacterium RIFOXYB2_FULL_39_7]OFZ10752.1 MAG: AI-2E family transporter [Bacteroidetes bacterium RIFOXYC2_FULL_39_11]HCT93221.1 AI-2E family transporter [Rikenellaceae bacterium]
MPFFVKISIFITGVYFLIYMLYIAQGIIVPLLFSVFIAIVLNPVVNFLTKFKINRIVAIAVSVIITLILFAAFGIFLVSQASMFGESWPVLVKKFTEYLNLSISWASDYFDASPQKIIDWIATTKEEFLQLSGSSVGQTLMYLGSGIIALLLIPVYVFMILYYKPLILDFFHRLFGENNKIRVNDIISETKVVVQRYLTGLIIETAIMAVLNSSVLLILGIEYAILLGIIGALLNLIPYIGGLIAVALPMMIALATKSTAWYALYVLIFYYIIQLIDNNYIVPKIVASKVKINALVSIIAVIAFGVLWGVPGMFVSIPLTAVVKLVFDRIDSLKPWGYLLGDTMPTKRLFIFKKV